MNREEFLTRRQDPGGELARPSTLTAFLARGFQAVFKRSRPPVDDPPEAWEVKDTPIDWEFWGKDKSVRHPFVPFSSTEVPEGAFEDLTNACGVTELRRLFVIPRNVRRAWVDSHPAHVFTPTHVLGIGEEGIGLWVSRPTPHVESVIRYEEIVCIEQIHILLYGRLTLETKNGKLTVRYNTVAEQELEGLVEFVRRKVASDELEVPAGEGPDEMELPFKWDLIARSDSLVLGESRPLSLAFAETAGRRRAKHHALLALTPRELIYLHDPYNSDHNYGADGTYVARSGIEGVRFDDLGIICAVAGRPVDMRMPAELVSAAHRWFDSLCE